MALKTALVVDDSKSARKMLQKLLTKKSLETDAVENGEAAIEYLQGRDTYPDVIFMDHMMPGMNGLETTKKISDTPELNSIPIVMFTSKEDPEYMETARSHGASAVLRKPLTPSELDEVIGYINELTEQVNESGIAATQEEEQDMQTAAQIPEINYEEIETLSRLAAETAAREAVADCLPDALSKHIATLKSELIAEMPEAEDTSAMREEVRNIQEQMETLQGRMAAIVEAMQAQQSNDVLSDELKQQVDATAEAKAETVSAEVAEKVALTIVEDNPTANSESTAQPTGDEYQQLKFMSKAGLAAAIVALIIAIF
jgi:CheY-like chemotaxis protein